MNMNNHWLIRAVWLIFVDGFDVHICSVIAFQSSVVLFSIIDSVHRLLLVHILDGGV